MIHDGLERAGTEGLSHSLESDRQRTNTVYLYLFLSSLLWTNTENDHTACPKKNKQNRFNNQTKKNECFEVKRHLIIMLLYSEDHHSHHMNYTREKIAQHCIYLLH